MGKAGIMNIELDIQEKKLELIRWLSVIENPAVVRKLLEIKEYEIRQEHISDAEKRSIEKGISDAEKGKLFPHSKAKSVYEKWL